MKILSNMNAKALGATALLSLTAYVGAAETCPEACARFANGVWWETYDSVMANMQYCNQLPTAALQASCAANVTAGAKSAADAASQNVYQSCSATC